VGGLDLPVQLSIARVKEAEGLQCFCFVLGGLGLWLVCFFSRGGLCVEGEWSVCLCVCAKNIGSLLPGYVDCCVLFNEGRQ
jgi:hypothetical protein